MRKSKVSLCLWMMVITTSLSGCEEEWNLVILKNGRSVPTFCLTNGAMYCDGQGLQIAVSFG